MWEGNNEKVIDSYFDFYNGRLDHLAIDIQLDMGLLRSEPAWGMGCGCVWQGFAAFSHGGFGKIGDGSDADLTAAGGGDVR